MITLSSGVVRKKNILLRDKTFYTSKTNFLLWFLLFNVLQKRISLQFKFLNIFILCFKTCIIKTCCLLFNFLCIRTLLFDVKIRKEKENEHSTEFYVGNQLLLHGQHARRDKIFLFISRFSALRKSVKFVNRERPRRYKY